jgi:molybdenum cofactor synthesis domain-containing protein
VNVAILVVGDEILTGRTRDANGGWLAARFTILGHRVVQIRVTPDLPSAIGADVRALASQAEMVAVTGGLGPTHDDITTESVAKAFGVRLTVSEAWLEKLNARYASRYASGLPPHVLASARKMATIPEGAAVLGNPKGAACGALLKVGAASIAIMPGVPVEMQAMFEEEVVPLLAKGAEYVEEEVRVKMPEAEFSAELEAVARAHPEVSIGSYPTWGSPVVTLRIRGPPIAATAVRKEIEGRFLAALAPPGDAGPRGAGDRD